MSTSIEQFTIAETKPRQSWQLPALVIFLAVVWWLVWGQLQNIADWLTYSLIGLQPETHLAESVLAFMMSVVALSLPEMLILKRVLKTPLIIIFITIVATAIIITGYLFNFIIG